MKKNYLYLLLLPGVFFLIFFVVIPIFNTMFSTLRVGGALSLQRYYDFFDDPYFVNIYLRTLKLSLITTTLCIIMGFPTAYYISKKGVNRKGFYIVLAVFPLLTSPVVRSFSWMVVLGKRGIVNNLLQATGLTGEPLSLLYNEFSIIIGLTHLFLPLMVLSLVGVMENIDDSLMRAAQSLGASRLRAFLRVIVPLSIPGLIVGSVLVFTGSLTAYTTPSLLGGAQTRVMSTLVYENAMTLSDWTTASVIATIMILTTMTVSIAINTLNKKYNY